MDTFGKRSATPASMEILGVQSRRLHDRTRTNQHAAILHLINFDSDNLAQKCIRLPHLALPSETVRFLVELLSF